MVQVFYENLENLYNKHHYQSSEIWNVDESRANASKNGVERVFAAKGTRSVHSMIPNEREWLSVLAAINANGDTIPNFYIFKGIRPRSNYLALCERGATYRMQKKVGRCIPIYQMDGSLHSCFERERFVNLHK